MRKVHANWHMQYQEYPPPAALAGQIQCIWRLRDAAPPDAPRTIFPDGHCELIAHLAVPPLCWDIVDGWHPQARTLFAAQRIVAVRLRSPGALDCVGVRLRPALSNAVIAGAAQRYRDRVVDLAALDAPFARALARAARNFARDRHGPLWNLVTRRLAETSHDVRIAGAVARIESAAGRVRIDALARLAALSPRGFQLRFRKVVGLTPKEFARLVRLQSILRALDQDESSVAEVASDGGFPDQAHATRELRRVTGHTPARLRRELRRHLNQGDGDLAIRLAAAFVRGTSNVKDA
jgi:AraC-like DNA-binding protein